MLKIRGNVFFLLFMAFSVLSFAEETNTIFQRIVVTKNRAAETGIYSLTQNSLQQLPFNSPVEALSITLLNLQARSPVNSIQADFSLRGSNFQGVSVLINGQRINDPQTGHHNSDIPLTKEDILNIDVLSGVSSLGFGPDAIGGAVNFVTKRPEERKVVLELSGGEYGSFGQLFSVSDKIRNLGLRFSVENSGSKGFSEDTDFKKFTAGMVSSLDLPSGSFDLDFGYQEKEFGAYDFYTPGMGYPSKEWTRTYLLNSSLNINKGDLIIKPKFLWRRHFDKFMLDKTQVRSNYLARHHTDIYTPGVYFNKRDTLLGNLGLGLEYTEEKIKSTSLGKHSRNQESIFIDDDYRINDLVSLNSVFRIDNYDGKDISYTGAAKLLFEIKEASFVHLGISRAMRIPSFTELYYDDPTTVGNPVLSPEKSLTYEAGYAYRQSKFSLSSVIFLREEDGFIDWVKPSPAQARWEAANISSSVVFGVEENIQYEFCRWLSLKANYAYTNRTKDDNGYLYKYGDNYSRHLTSLISIFRFGFGSQEMGFTYKKTPSRNGWILVHARLNYNLNRHSKFFLSANNIFNVEYQEISGIPSPGRWVEGGLRLEW